DAFERFESSSAGWLIPVVIFVLGALATRTAMVAVRQVELAEQAAMERLAEEEALPPAENMNQELKQEEPLTP
ncbi:MAG: hypothetical protein MI861_15885, partial [Pirellulales bacterium]|nr:hypothetical protein [Pirellulales bacterium]